MTLTGSQPRSTSSLSSRLAWASRFSPLNRTLFVGRSMYQKSNATSPPWNAIGCPSLLFPRRALAKVATRTPQLGAPLCCRWWITDV